VLVSKQQDEVARTMAGPPNGYFLVVPPGREEARVDLNQAVRCLLKSWKMLIGITLLGGVVAAVVAVQMRNVYRSQVLLAPVTQTASSAASSLGGQMGGLASLVGLNLGGGGEREQAIATLNSPGLAREFIAGERLLPVLFAERWDAAKQQWTAGSRQPTTEDGVRLFTSSVRTIVEDRRTGIITIRVDWYDPDMASRWANKFVALANEQLRDRAITTAEASIEYLKAELAKTDVVPVRQAIFKLMEGQINNAMLANVQRDYAFRIIDGAVASDKKSKVSPHRTLIAIGGAVAAGLITASWILWRRRSAWLSQETRTGG